MLIKCFFNAGFKLKQRSKARLKVNVVNMVENVVGL